MFLRVIGNGKDVADGLSGAFGEEDEAGVDEVANGGVLGEEAFAGEEGVEEVFSEADARDFVDGIEFFVEAGEIERADGDVLEPGFDAGEAGVGDGEIGR